jgi:hypothetical protein
VIAINTIYDLLENDALPSIQEDHLRKKRGSLGDPGVAISPPKPT